MKRVVLLLFSVLLLVPSIMKADSTRGQGLGMPITLVKDTSILGTFPSRMQLFPDAIFCGVTGNAIFVPGFAFAPSDFFSILYMYMGNGKATPAMALATAAVPAPAATLTKPINFNYGMKAGSLYIGLGYGYSYMDAQNKTVDNAGVEQALIQSTYNLHEIKPAISLILPNMSMDLAVDLNLQALNNIDYALAGPASNVVLPASGFETLGATFQFNLNLAPTTLLAVRAFGTHQNMGYSTINTIANTTNEVLNHVNNFGATAGISFKPVSFLEVFLDMRFAITETFTPNLRTVAMTHLPSTTLGAEAKFGAWYARLAAVYTCTTTTTYNTGGGNLVTTVNAPVSTVTPQIGIGYKKLPWVINARLNPALLNDTLSLFSGNANTPVLRVSVNYVFFTKDKSKNPASVNKKAEVKPVEAKPE